MTDLIRGYIVDHPRTVEYVCVCEEKDEEGSAKDEKSEEPAD